ncbi:hypothetical protein KIKIMORA_02360 [Brevundimonas phage vB_BpoS-Kikimora]|uniref:Uncharacterized protein n=1 Tax=Brevundimonas phage vB_BpoS-Kikimora TaxID=2948601 RepID=A0A9E7MTB4_9CAUD|nr:hypothetical protein KIKIMORA_02360 [Brevundimonas phage vB_BpoS-Kikimora]
MRDVTELALMPDTLPWELDHTVTDEQGASAIVDQDRCAIAFMSDDGLTEEEAEAIINARGRLMAASPQLYQALLQLFLTVQNDVPFEIAAQVRDALTAAGGADE